MNILSWAEDKANKLSLWDIGILKITAMVSGLIAGALGSSLVKRRLRLLIIVLVLGGGYLVYRWFSVDSNGDT